MTPYICSNMIWQQNTGPFPKNKAYLYSRVPAQHVHASEVVQSDATWQHSNVGFIYEKKKRPKDAKSKTLGVYALRCHLLHVNQQWSRRGRRQGGSETLSWKTASRAKASTAHMTPSIACPHCTSIELRKALFGKQNEPHNALVFPSEKYIPYCFCLFYL